MIFENQYGFFDQLLHRLAFRSVRTQEALAEVEGLVFRRDLRTVSPSNAVFISGLPRSGTTILLNLLFRTGHFACHLYRDMPFVLCPMLWHRFSSRFEQDDSPRERAHGDGLTVSGDDPEGFEEMIWKHFWKDHYEDDRILPWGPSESNPAFTRFMESHVKKVVTLRTRSRSGTLRYLSKNNTSIARIASRPPPLDQGLILVPFREPLQQAASMHRQHKRFLEIHKEDGFVYRYMEAIGHHEFGAGLRPIDFDGWLSDAPDPTTFEFWLAYWSVAYRHVLEHRGSSVVLISYDGLTADPESALLRLEKALDIPGGRLSSQAGRIRPPRNHMVDEAEISPELRETTSALYRLLQRGGVN